MTLGKVPWLAMSVLAICHLSVLLAGFFAPGSFEVQNRNLAFAPPTRIHFVDAQGRFHLRPFVYRWVLRPGSFAEYEENQQIGYPLHFFVPGAEYKVLGIFNSRQHLFGTGEETRIFLLGTDAYGRDLFSRLLYGGMISLFTGLLAATASALLGLVLGGLAGYYGHWVDEVTMRIAEIFLAMPWLYLLLAVRALLPLHVDPQATFFLLIGVLGVIGWARPARLVRGIVLTAKEREYVLAARSFGAPDLYLLRTHILPFASGAALNQMALYIPQYILAEVTLSFFGLGVSEPIPSWGNMLNDLQHYLIWGSYWWLFSPAIVLVAVLLAYYRLFSFFKVNSFTF
ncbi:MAG: ABC transporter permease [Acidobacteriaceae bacterium]|nr:ABC transporter permease [Acidobacteriaceae bacterium]